MKFKNFEQFISEDYKFDSDLQKVYLAIDPDSGHRWWSYKDFAGDNFFQQITPENYKDIKIDSSYPILNYSSKLIKKLLNENLIKKDNIYNLPEFVKNSGSKEKFHKIVKDDENIPKTVFSKEKALKLEFPVIAKPKAGHSGIGIKIFKTPEDLKESNENNFDLFSEFIEKKEEHRFFLFNSEPFFWMKREPMNDKAKSGKGSSDSKMSFKYIKEDINKIPENYQKVLNKFAEKFSNLPYICFDIMETVDNKLMIIESNTMPGVPYDSTVKIYENIFKDFYKRDINTIDAKKLSDFSEYLDKKTLELDSKRFEIRK